jgi:hypothetical protein
MPSNLATQMNPSWKYTRFSHRGAHNFSRSAGRVRNALEIGQRAFWACFRYAGMISTLWLRKATVIVENSQKTFLVRSVFSTSIENEHDRVAPIACIAMAAC